MNIIAIGGHPDDIEVLVGGTLAKYKSMGHNVKGIILSDVTKERWKEAKAGAKILNINIEYFTMHRDIQFIEHNIKLLDVLFNKYKPNIIFTHHPGDSHQGHQSAAKLVFAACRNNNATVLLYERALPGGITPYPFRPQYFVDISDFIKQKIAAVKCHKTQGAEKWVQSVKGRARYWGQVLNCKYGEAFEINKIVDPLSWIK